MVFTLESNQKEMISIGGVVVSPLDVQGVVSDDIYKSSVDVASGEGVPLFIRVERTGSSMLRGYPSQDLDYHSLVQVSDEDLVGVVVNLQGLGWKLLGQQGGDYDSDYINVFEKQIDGVKVNLLLYSCLSIYEFMNEATNLMVRFNLVNKEDRYALFKSMERVYAITYIETSCKVAKYLRSQEDQVVGSPIEGEVK